MEIISYKTCGTCRNEKRVSEFNKHARQKDGIARICRECDRAYNAEYREKNRASINEKIAANRIKTRDEIRARHTKFHAKNPEKQSQYSAQYRIKNPEKRKEICAKYRATNTEKDRIRRSLWASENLDKLAARSAKRRALKLQSTPQWANDGAIISIYAEAKKMTSESGDPHHVDHIVPLKSKIVCGLHCEANLQILIGKDNLSKGNRHWPDMP